MVPFDIEKIININNNIIKPNLHNPCKDCLLKAVCSELCDIKKLAVLSRTFEDVKNISRELSQIWKENLRQNTLYTNATIILSFLLGLCLFTIILLMG